MGYQKVNSKKATVYITEVTKEDSVVFQLDKIIEDVERFHGLKYTSEFKIIIVSKNAHMRRFLPWLQGSGYSVSLGIADVIYIGPVARTSPKGIEQYIRHELSHLLISQNTSFEKARLIQEQAWFSEGIAEYVSGHSFYRKSDFIKICRNENFQFNGLNEMNPHQMSFKELKFNYTYYKFFIDFLIDTYGLKAFHNYLSEYLEEPQEYMNLFLSIYKSDLGTLLNHFKLSLDLED